MNRLYTYYPRFDSEDNLLWTVFETATEQVVGEYFFEEDAQDFMMFLESGGGFFGFTPSFMLRKAPIHININDAFAAEFA